jgi:hypothetical protein
MPYIKQEDRKRYNLSLDAIPTILTKGDMEYCVTKLMWRYMGSRVWSYSALHEAVYATIHAADEFRRRHLDVREDRAIEANGDIP